MLAIASSVAVLFRVAYLKFPTLRIIQESIDTLYEYNDLTLEDLHEMISETRGFYVRDWSLWLGWNNV